ncbi:putative transcriptional regulator [Bacillus sp. TS-2]|nr:putative transcriptional regulator [Bacillus sp. TS-2]
MEYSINQVAKISGISKRTLRYYDEIGLLKPARVNSSGYRIYREGELAKLQQILFYRELEMKLEDIKEIISSPKFDIEAALHMHYKQLQSKRKQLDDLIDTVERTLKSNKGEIHMSIEDKFEAFKRKKIAENEENFGKEIRDQYGKKEVEASNQKWMKLSEQDFKEMQELESKLFLELEKLAESKDIESTEAKNVFEYHKKWLMYTWSDYSSDAHKGLADLYVSDQRFTKYYNERAGNEVVGFLSEAIKQYA